MIKEHIVPCPGEVKFIFFSGKGGVGKSTMSCATALWLAKSGFKTLLVTTDPAPNLSDIFGQKIGHQITPIQGLDHLDAIEINPDRASEEYRDRIVAPLKELLDEKNLNIIREQLNSPCVEEVAAFDKFIEFMDDPDYDVVVFDTAPTGHTIRLLELPSGWSDALQQDASTCIGPAASLQSAKAKYEKAISYLQDRRRTSFIFVLKPEHSSLLETRRSSEELSKLGITTSLLIINGVLPQDACTDEFFQNKRKAELRIIERIGTEFPTLSRTVYPLRDIEVTGIELLDSVAKFLFEGEAEKDHIGKPDEIVNSKPYRISDRLENCLDLLKPVNNRRFIFFTGKGGVGKSTIACTISLYLAEHGFKTLIVTTDPASHLQDIFGQEINHEPSGIHGVEKLYAARIDQHHALEEYRARIMAVIKDQGESVRKSVEEDLNSPCAEEMAAFEKFMSYFERNEYEIVVFDTAPTGHTLRLLELPTDWKGFIDLGSLTLQTSQSTQNKYADVIETMRSKDKSTFVFVVYPEYTPIVEAWRAAEDLKKQVGIETAIVAVNYILPEGVGKNAFFESRRRQQDKYLAEIESRFQKPMIFAPLLDQEPKGIDRLRELGKKICDAD